MSEQNHKKIIKIKFSGMTGFFDPENNFIINELRKCFIVELSDNPDYLIFSTGSNDWYKYKCVRIFFTPENIVPNFNLADYAIGFSELDFGDRYIRYPLFLVNSFSAYKNDDYGNSLSLALKKHIFATTSKEGFCSFVCSNSKGASCREEIFKKLNEYKKVDSGGLYKNNINARIVNKLDFQKKYKFSIAFENTSTPGYTTEKIIDSYAAQTVPIYWGDPNISKTFNPNSFINCNDFGLNGYDKESNRIAIKKIINLVKKIDNDDVLYIKMLQEPAFLDPLYVEKEKQKFSSFLINIFSQEKEKAYRRNRYYWGERYEKRQALGTFTFYFLNHFRIKNWFRKK